MEKIGQIKPQSAVEIFKLIKNLNFFSVLTLKQGKIDQDIGDGASLTADLTSLVGNLDFRIQLDGATVKELAAMYPGNHNVEIFETEDGYRLRGGLTEVELIQAPVFPLLGARKQPGPNTEVIFNFQMAAKSAEAKAFDKLAVGKGPIIFEFDATGTCTGVVNKFGSRIRWAAQAMVPPQHRRPTSPPALALTSFWLDAFHAKAWALTLVREPTDDPFSDGNAYWLRAEISFGSGVGVTLLENLVPELLLS